MLHSLTMRRLLPHPHFLLTETRTNKKWTYHNNNYHDNSNYLYHLALAIHLTPLNLLSSMNRSNPPFFTTPSIGSTSWRFHLWLCTPLMPSVLHTATHKFDILLVRCLAVCTARVVDDRPKCFTSPRSDSGSPAVFGVHAVNHTSRDSWYRAPTRAPVLRTLFMLH